MRVHLALLLTFIFLSTFTSGQEAAKAAESSVTLENVESESPENVTKEIDTSTEKRKEETRRQISDAIAQSSRLLVALKTEIDINIETKEVDKDMVRPSTFVMFLRKGLSKILGFKIALLKFLAIGTDKVNEQALSNSTSHSFEVPPEKSNQSNEESRKITEVKPAPKKKRKKGNNLANWLKAHNITSDSKCDVVILVKKCELKAEEECTLTETCTDGNDQPMCKKPTTPTKVCKTVERNLCRYVPVNKNCHP